MLADLMEGGSLALGDAAKALPLEDQPAAGLAHRGGKDVLMAGEEPVLGAVHQPYQAGDAPLDAVGRLPEESCDVDGFNPMAVDLLDQETVGFGQVLRQIQKPFDVGAEVDVPTCIPALTNGLGKRKGGH